VITDKEPVVFDLELMGKGDDIFFFFGARHLATGRTIELEGNDHATLTKLITLMRNERYLWVSFNGIKFDAPVLAAVMGGRSLAEVKRMANTIIEEKKPAWMSYRDFKLEPLDIDHIDLIEVAPGVMINLKLYAARMGLKSIVDLPFAHDAHLTPADRAMIKDYCINGDLVATASLFKELQGALELREQMSQEYLIDLRSKSDAQVAETVLSKVLGIRGAVDVPSGVRYAAPKFIQPRNAVLVEKLERAERLVFKLNHANGAIELPPFLEEPIVLGKGRYQMGIGGLHSQHDRQQHWIATEKLEISDFDVASFYPNIILNAGLIPRGLGYAFIEQYRKILMERLAAKRSGNKVKDGAMKIMLNGTFGKLGSMFSKLYAPDLMLATTVTGQFYLLGLIEVIIEHGGQVISANTDGVCVAATPAVMASIRDAVWLYGWATNFEFEETKYRTIAIKDVNNYLAVTVAGKIKAKGIYALGGLMKNPTNEVCTLAAQAYLRDGTPVDQFIHGYLSPETFADFTQSRSVTGGAVFYTDIREVDDWINLERGAWYRQAWYDMGKERKPLKRVSRPAPVTAGDKPVFLGRVARWYYSLDEKRSIHYVNNDNKVPKANASTACMKLPDTIPQDLDVGRYIEEAKTNLRNMGVRV
jgi:hypothetical protein